MELLAHVWGSEESLEGARHNLAGLIQEIAAGLRQHDAAADAVKELDPVTRFERRDRGAGC